MRVLTILRNLAFLIILISAFTLSKQVVSAYDDDPQCMAAGDCHDCNSGNPCKLGGGDPNACNQWDNDGLGDDCDPTNPPTYCSSGGVLCNCHPCLEG